MVNLILNSVTKQLGKTFGNSYRYYLENVEQGLTKPCFTADVLVPLQRSRNAVLYDRTMPVVLHYFSSNEQNKKQDCYSVGERAVECLEYLPIDGFESVIIRGEDISYKVVDDVLQIFITYKFRTRLITEVEDTPEEIIPQITHG